MFWYISSMPIIFILKVNKQTKKAFDRNYFVSQVIVLIYDIHFKIYTVFFPNTFNDLYGRAVLCFMRAVIFIHTQRTLESESRDFPFTKLFRI